MEVTCERVLRDQFQGARLHGLEVECLHLNLENLSSENLDEILNRTECLIISSDIRASEPIETHLKSLKSRVDYYGSKSYILDSSKEIHLFIGPRSLIVQKISSLLSSWNKFDNIKHRTVSMECYNLKKFNTVQKYTGKNMIITLNPRGASVQDEVMIYGQDESEVKNLYSEFLAPDLEISAKSVTLENIMSLFHPLGIYNTATSELKEPSSVVNGEFEESCDDLSSFLSALSNKALSEKIVSSFNLIYDQIKQNGLDSVSISFNGGKDSTVALHLLIAARKKYCIENNITNPGKLSAMHSLEKVPFVELVDFTLFCEKRYKLSVHRFVGSHKECLRNFLNEIPAVKFIVMGNKTSDPFGENTKPMQKTDPNWPSVIRLNPLADWSYGETWDFLLELKKPYCSLYCHGFTSLDGIDNTIPNPSLKDHTSPFGYKHASKLEIFSQERLGRLDPSNRQNHIILALL